MVDSLLFLHAATGCDSNSSVYRKGKRGPFRKLQAQPALCTAVHVFNHPQTYIHAIAAAGEAFLCVVYGRKIDNNLNVKRHQLYLRGPLRNRKCARNSTWRRCHQRQQHHVNTRFGCTTKYSSGVESLQILPTGDGG